MECGVELVPLQNLPPSADALLDEPPELVLPEHERRSWADFSRGRGALLLLALLGLSLFFSPWVEIILPESEVRSGFDLARGRAGWLWGGAVGYFVLLPLVWTRRSIAGMRGVRIAVTLLAITTLAEVAMLLLLPPRGHGMVPVAIAWRWGLYASGAASLCAAVVASRFGGALPPLDAFLAEETPASPAPATHTERRTLH